MSAPKPTISREELREIIKVSLWAGQLLLQHGADSAKVQETVHRIGTGLGCDWIDVVVNYDSIIASTIYQGDFRTKVRYVPQRATDMTILAKINQCRRQIEDGLMDYQGLYAELRALDKPVGQYPKWLVILAVGLACGAFSQLFGGTTVEFLITCIASSIAVGVRQKLNRHYFNQFLIVTLTACIATFSTSILQLILLGKNSEISLASSVIFLVPGVSLINSAEDLFHGQISTGIVRGVVGFLIALCIAFGFSSAIWIWGA